MRRTSIRNRLIAGLVVCVVSHSAWGVAHMPDDPKEAEVFAERLLMEREVEIKLQASRAEAAKQQRQAIADQLRSIRKPRTPEGGVVGTPAAVAGPNVESLDERTERYTGYAVTAGAVLLMGFLLAVLYFVGRERKKWEQAKLRQSARLELKAAQSKRITRPVSTTEA